MAYVEMYDVITAARLLRHFVETGCNNMEVLARGSATLKEIDDLFAKYDYGCDVVRGMDSDTRQRLGSQYLLSKGIVKQRATMRKRISHCPQKIHKSKSHNCRNTTTTVDSPISGEASCDLSNK